MMKRVWSLILALGMVLSLSACGQSEAAKNVDDQIDAIGEITLDSETLIGAAEDALDALAEDDAKQVTGAADLAAARLRYNALVVENAIAAIGEVTLDSGEAISAARDALEDCSEEVRAAVGNAGELESAEAAFSQLQAAEASALIDAIGEVDLDDGENIAAAREMLDALSDEDAAQVANTDVLVAAEEQLKALKKAEAEKLLANMRLEDDKVRGMKFYSPKAWPYYTDYWAADVRCFMLPYIGTDGSNTWLRLTFNYTGDDWVFFKKVTIAADDERFYKFFNYFDITHDNGGGSVWENIDVEVDDSDMEMLRAVADSAETIIRFEGDDYRYDHTVLEKDKAAIREVLTAYDALK